MGERKIPACTVSPLPSGASAWRDTCCTYFQLDASAAPVPPAPGARGSAR
ncbi:MAG TPA: hypothetical protein VHB21_16225 [Minicystis sp.]|nr:hypothetical protein [Minicystis sp.]